VLDVIRDKPFLVAILAGTGAQLLKVIAFLIAEKRVNYRRFVQPGGAPNMHSATFGALMLAVALVDGFGSQTFALAAVLTAIILVDTMNVKNATSRQKEAVLLILDRVRQRQPRPEDRIPRRSYTPVDVFVGLAAGMAFAFLFYR
jgi:acid phosphatase family membrane protein YuiD